MTVTFVTAFVRPKTSYRSVDAYVSEFNKLASTGVSIILFLDSSLQLDTFPKNVQIIPTSVTTDWLPDTLEFPSRRNPSKDTLDYFCIQLMKLKWLRDAVEVTSSSHLAWIDFGAFHMFRDTARCQQMLQTIAVSDFPSQKIIAPGCWSSGVYDWNSVCWRFCGTFLLGHRSLFEEAYRRQTQRVHAKLPRITWEVNYWAEMEDLFEVYLADHDDSLLSRVMVFVHKHQGVLI